MFTQSESRVKPPAPSKNEIELDIDFCKYSISKPIKLKMCLKKYHINTLKNA